MSVTSASEKEKDTEPEPEPETETEKDSKDVKIGSSATSDSTESLMAEVAAAMSTTMFHSGAPTAAMHPYYAQYYQYMYPYGYTAAAQTQTAQHTATQPQTSQQTTAATTTAAMDPYAAQQYYAQYYAQQQSQASTLTPTTAVTATPMAVDTAVTATLPTAASENDNTDTQSKSDASAPIQSDAPTSSDNANTNANANANVNANAVENMSVSNVSETSERQPTPTPPLLDWGCAYVSNWVTTVADGRFAKYKDTFLTNEVTGADLVEITVKDLQRGLYINNMRDRLDLFDCIQQVKNKGNNDITMAVATTGVGAVVPSVVSQIAKDSNGVIDVSALPRAPVVRKNRKRKRKDIQSLSATAALTDSTNELSNKGRHSSPPQPTTVTHLSTSDIDTSNHNIARGTAAFLGRSHDTHKSVAQILAEKSVDSHQTMTTTVNVATIEKPPIQTGTTHEIKWNFRTEKTDNNSDALEPLHISVGDCVRFEWEYTRNVWQFPNRTAFETNDFSAVEQLAASNVNEYVWNATKPVTIYFGCQIGVCSKLGSLKIAVHVYDKESWSKRRRLR